MIRNKIIRERNRKNSKRISFDYPCPDCEKWG